MKAEVRHRALCWIDAVRSIIARRQRIDAVNGIVARRGAMPCTASARVRSA
jgi:hypothetical protein